MFSQCGGPRPRISSAHRFFVAAMIAFHRHARYPQGERNKADA